MDTLFDTSVYLKTKTPLTESFKTKRPIALRIAEAVRNLKWPNNYHIVDQKKVGLEDIARKIEESGEFVFDCETSGLNAWRDEVLCISIYVRGQAFVIPFDHNTLKCIHPDLFRKVLKPHFSDPNIRRMNHNIKFDGHFIEERLRTPVGDAYCDTMLMAWVVDPTGDHGLKELCLKYAIDPGGANYTKQFGRTSWAYIHPQLACYYACKDVDLVQGLFEKQSQILSGKPKLNRLFWDLEMPVLNLAFDMERQGLTVDSSYVDTVLRPQVYTEHATATEALRPFIEPHLAQISKKTGWATSVAEVLESSKQLSYLFFDILGLPEVKHYTLVKDPKTGEFTKRSLDKNAIAAFKNKFEYMRLLGEYRKVATVKKMFVDKLPDLVTDGRIHPTINIIGAETGRMSMSDPNLQQVPSRMGPLVRQMFVPAKGNILVAKDFSGQEMRIQAHFALRGRLVDFYLNEPDLDIYSKTALDVLPHEEFDKFDKLGLTHDTFKSLAKDERKKTKVYAVFKSLVLGLGYGMGPRKFAMQVGIPEKEAVRLYGLYFETYPELREYQQRAIKFTRQHGYIVTLLGRERPLPFINSFDMKWRGMDERAAINTPIQGTAADQVKIAAKKANDLILSRQWPLRIALLIHDEIIFEGKASWVRRNSAALDEINTIMETALPLIVPSKCSTSIEKRWGIGTDIEKLELLEEAI